MHAELAKIGYGSFCDMNVEGKAKVFTQVMTETNDRLLGRMRERGRKSVWWSNKELSSSKEEGRRLKRKFQNSRKYK